MLKEHYLNQAKMIVIQKKQSEMMGRQRIHEFNEMKFVNAQMVKDENKYLKKKIGKNSRQYIFKAQEKIFELKVIKQASKIKNEQHIMNRLENQKRLKEEELNKQGKLIVKRDKEAKKLEILEAEVLKRLRDTHVKQQ